MRRMNCRWELTILLAYVIIIMVGFAAAPGSYSESVGHMTMGCGYIMQNSNTYLLALADGHSSSIVYKLWSSVYNDCIITVNIFK